ncbi:MAG TPA: Gfo/Idh/MocA family oxidoreductase [Gemmataceae bacterium]|jgi:predicted dehydrogenase|nr:Gfo/Idh/MocA family oxidoreductase [Gemmataceae bacterium]
MTEKRQDGARLSTRREFLKTTTIAAAGTAVAANLSILSNAYAAGSDEIRVGVVGCGGRASGAAENVLHAAPNVKIVAIGDVFKFRANDMRSHLRDLAERDETVKKLGNSVDLPEERCFVGLNAYKHVLNAGINYVILATPPGFRPVHLEAAVAAGKNIFTEKPVGVDGTGIRKVLAAYEEAKKKGLGVGAGTQRRHQLGYVETMKRIHDGAIGDLVAARCYWNQGPIWFRSRRELTDHGIKPTELAFQLHNWYHFVWLCGDHICEQHVHNLDVCNWAMHAHPVRAVGMGGRAARAVGDPAQVGHIFDFFAIDYEYPHGVHVLSQCRQIDNCENSVSEALAGTKGHCQANAYKINGQHVISKEQDEAATDAYVQEHTDLIASIRSGKPYNELKNVAHSTLTAIMGRMSAYTGKAVSWKDALESKMNTMPEKLSWDMSISVPQVAVPGKTALE